MRIGEVLSNISERGSGLPASTLCRSNHALVEEYAITLFHTGGHHRGLPAGGTPFSFDHALFQIHVAKLTIQQRMTRLELDAKVVQRYTIESRSSNDTNTLVAASLAMTHIHRRNVLLAEVKRCSMMLTKLDASELRLETMRGDVQVLQHYKSVREALKDIRTSEDGNIAGSSTIENVEELMLDMGREGRCCW
mmetsp:Transcript_25416/g.39990  ORF Transcript_25416/g.39990 Transcript_25416/m.39990 type:complete len:193 (-) Transcript_25416:701-1279(-)